MKIQEKTRTAASGYLALVVLPALTLLFGAMLFRSAVAENAVMAVIYVLAAQAVGPNHSLTQLSRYKKGPDLPMAGKRPRQVQY